MNCCSSSKSRYIKKIVILAWLVSVMLSASSPKKAAAHTDGKMQLAAVPAGPYKLTVWTWPEPPRTGENHISIALVLAEDASPVLDANIIVEVMTTSGDIILSAPATTENSENKFLYEVVMEIPQNGIYYVTIAVSGGDAAEVDYQMEVFTDRVFNPLWLIPIAIVIVGVSVWLIRKNRRAVP